jgi:hypothetical protein
MTTEDIIRIAQEAKQYAEYVTPQGMEWFDIYNERFAVLIASAAQAKEREACAKVCEEIYTGEEACGDWPTPEMCADAIRARGQE